MHTIKQKLVVQMWRLRQARRTHETNDLTLFNSLTFFHGSVGEMQVLGDDAVGVLDKYVVTIEFAVSGLNDLAITRGKYRCALGCPVVNTIVGFVLPLSP